MVTVMVGAGGLHRTCSLSRWYAGRTAADLVKRIVQSPGDLGLWLGIMKQAASRDEYGYTRIEAWSTARLSVPAFTFAFAYGGRLIRRADDTTGRNHTVPMYLCVSSTEYMTLMDA